MSKFKELFPFQVYINLDSRPDRKEIVEQEFKKMDINPIRRAGMVPDPGTIEGWWKGVVGCLASHTYILQAAHLLDTNVFIFEDDVQFIESKEVIDKACEELENVEWDMFYLGGNILRPCNQVSPHLAKLTHCQSTVSYGINKKFLGKLLSYVDLKNIDRPIDVLYADTIIPNANAYITVPMVTVQRDSYSDIEGKTVNYTSYLEKRYWANLVKM